MPIIRNSLVIAAAVVLLAGCATPGTSGALGEPQELHQSRAERQAPEERSSAEAQGQRLADYAAARAAAGVSQASPSGAAEAQGARLEQYAAARLSATDGLSAPDAESQAEHRGTTGTAGPDRESWDQHRGVDQ